MKNHSLKQQDYKDTIKADELERPTSKLDSMCETIKKGIESGD